MSIKVEPLRSVSCHDEAPTYPPRPGKNTNSAQHLLKLFKGDLNTVLRIFNRQKATRVVEERRTERMKRREDISDKVKAIVAKGYSDRESFLCLLEARYDLDLALDMLKYKYRNQSKNNNNIKNNSRYPEEDMKTTEPEIIENKSAATPSKKASKCLNSDRSVKSQVEETPSHLTEPDPNRITEELKDLLIALEESTQTNRKTCHKYYKETGFDFHKTKEALNRARKERDDRMNNAWERRQNLLERKTKLNDLIKVTDYDREKCESILNFFEWNLEKACRQYFKFQKRKIEPTLPKTPPVAKEECDEDLKSLEHEEGDICTEVDFTPTTFEEIREKEQYFFSKETLDVLMFVLDNFDNPCCLAVPSLADAAYQIGRKVTLLDIDRRFDYLPGFKYFDLLDPTDDLKCDFDLIIFDPPFFQISTLSLVQSVDAISHTQDHRQKLIVSYLRRQEDCMLSAFKKYKIRPTKFHPEYSNIKSSKRLNNLFYSNWGGLPNNATVL